MLPGVPTPARPERPRPAHRRRAQVLPPIPLKRQAAVPTHEGRRRGLSCPRPARSYANVNTALLDHLADGAAYATETFAYSTLPVNGGRVRARTAKTTVQTDDQHHATR